MTPKHCTVDEPFDGEHYAGLNPLDPQLAIAWPLPVSEMAERDRNYPGPWTFRRYAYEYQRETHRRQRGQRLHWPACAVSLLQHDVEVVALCRDRASLTGWQERVEVVELDHASPPEQAYALMGRPDVLLHLAWQGLPNYQSLHHFEQELPRQYAFLRQLVAEGLPALVVAGTCFEYGLQSGPGMTHVPQPVTPYALAKHTLHQQLHFLARQTGLSLSWARLFSCTAPDSRRIPCCRNWRQPSCGVNPVSTCLAASSCAITCQWRR
jgi:hypothetical protein